MLPLKLIIDNFKLYNHAEIDFTKFQSAVILGRNKSADESNGTGKSSLLEAIDWVCCSSYSTDNLDGLVKDDCDFCQVEFHFESDGETYQIIKSRNKKSGKSNLKFSIKNGGNWRDLTQRTSTETEVEILKKIKLNYKSWQNSVSFTQSNIASLASAPTTEAKRAILKEVLNLGVYAKLKELAKEDSDKVLDKIEELKTSISNISDPQAQIVILEKQFQEIEQQIVNHSAELEKAENKILNKQEKVDDAKQEQNKLLELQNQWQELGSKINTANDEFNTINNNIRDYQNKINSINSNISETKKKLEIEKSLNFPEVREIGVVEKEIENWTEKETAGNVFLNSAQEKIAQLSKPLPTGPECTLCRQTVSDEYRETILSQSKESIEKLQNQITDAKGKIQKIKQKKSSLFEEIKNIKQIQQQIINKENKIQQLSQQLSSYNSSLESYQELLKHWENQVEAKNQEIIQLRTTRSQLQNHHQLYEESQNKLSDLIEELNSAKQEKKEIENNSNQFLIKKGGIEAKIEHQKQEIIKLADLQAKLLDYEGQAYIWQSVIQGFGTRIPSMIMHTVLDDLELETNLFLKEIRPRLQVQFKIQKEKKNQIEETLDIIYFNYGRERTYSQLSEGEKTMINFSFKIATSNIIKKRFGANIQYLALDEVDRAFDLAGKKTIQEIVKKLESQYKILVITHYEPFKAKFPTAIVVDYLPQIGATATVEDNELYQQ